MEQPKIKLKYFKKLLKTIKYGYLKVNFIL